MLGTRLREARELKRLKQIDVAPLIGITSQALSNYERGDRDPDTDTLNKLADIYNVTVDYLLGRDTPLTHPKETNLKDLAEFLEQPEIFFNGIPLTKEDIKKVKASLEIVFWDAKQKKNQEKL
jgi:transcriptional regulator with XRE-family HTH domain